jgi:hypothetical protein
MTATLKRALKDGLGLTDESHGTIATLYNLLKEMCENPAFVLTARQAAAATGIIGSQVVDKATRLRKLYFTVTDAGSANDTTIQILADGVLLTGATLTINNAEANNFETSVELDVAVPAGARIDINVSAIATAATHLVVSAYFNPFTVE